MAPTGVGDAGRAVGGLAVLPARLAIGQDAQPQHVHADRDGNWRCLALQRGGDGRAVDLSGRLPGRGRVGRRLFRGGRSEEHTSELQSLMRISYAVFCLKKKKSDKTSNLMIHIEEVDDRLS